MASKQDFTPEEWTKVLQSPMLVGIAVSTADPSGLWGTLKEAFASSSALSAARRDPASSELVRATVAEFGTPEGRSIVHEALQGCFAGAEPAQCVERSLAALKEVSAILDSKASSDAVPFKGWLQSIGEKVAAASVEDAFLGFGGARISDAEKATLDDIGNALGTNAPQRA